MQSNRLSPCKNRVVLGVTASDSHVVANHLIAHLLRDQGFDVVNLGACTTIEEFAEAAFGSPETLAVLIGSHNGHALQDLRGLADAKRAGKIRCPVVLGGNLSVGSQKDGSHLNKLAAEGVDLILESHTQIAPYLKRLQSQSAERTA